MSRALPFPLSLGFPGFRLARRRAKSGLAPLEKEKRPSPPEVRVHVCTSPVEVSYITMVFKDADIPFRMEGYGLDPYGVLYIQQRGLCTLIVSEADAAQARKLIDQLWTQAETSSA
ncbi:MAG: hypothetical protein CMH54_14590 [Myxococcales bacterium]|nr:hypothetical protein [Myxococcales bacterium]